MEAQPSLIMIQFLQWVADRPRRREDVMDAWRSSCPRFPVWGVELTERGRMALERALARL